MKVALISSALAFAVCLPLASSADEFVVNSTWDVVDRNPGDGRCDTGDGIGGAEECTLRAAVMEANASRGAHEIRLPAGLFVLTVAPDPTEEEDQRLGLGSSATAVRSGDLDIDVSVTISGAGEGLTIVDARGLQDRIFDIWITTLFRRVEFQNLTIRDGFTRGPGGCLYNRGGRFDVVLYRVTVESCTATSKVLPDGTVLGAGIGGGMLNLGTAELRRTTFRANSALRGAGVENGYQMTIEDSTFADNYAFPAPDIGVYQSSGGGVANVTTGSLMPRVDMQRSTVSNNWASAGGGIFNDGLFSVRNSTVSGNTGGRGAGIAFLAPAPAGPGGAMTVRHTTVTGNIGVGVLREGDGSLQILSSIIAHNGDSRGVRNCSGGNTETSTNMEDGDTCEFVGPGDWTSTDPLLGPLADNGGYTLTHALLPDSPAIDRGLPRGEWWEPTDQRGVPRPLGPASDIGAYEYGMDPRALVIGIPYRWAELFRGGNASPTAFTMRLRLGDGVASSGPPGTDAALLNLIPAKGQGQMKVALDRDGQWMEVSGIAMPAGDNSGNPELFTVEVRQSLRRSTILWAEQMSCDCTDKPRKLLPKPIPRYKPKQLSTLKQ